MSWYKITLSVDQVSGESLSLQRAFGLLHLSNGAPRDAGMFRSLKMGSWGSFSFYFSPGAARIAGPLIASYAGVECPAPKRSEVSNLVAIAGAAEIPFAPES